MMVGADLTGHLLGMTMDGVDPRGLAGANRAGVSPVGVTINGSQTGVLLRLDGTIPASLVNKLKDPNRTNQVKDLLHGGDLAVVAARGVAETIGNLQNHRGRVPSHLALVKWMKV